MHERSERKVPSRGDSEPRCLSLPAAAPPSPGCASADATPGDGRLLVGDRGPPGSVRAATPSGMSVDGSLPAAPGAWRGSEGVRGRPNAAGSLGLCAVTVSRGRRPRLRLGWGRRAATTTWAVSPPSTEIPWGPDNPSAAQSGTRPRGSGRRPRRRARGRPTVPWASVTGRDPRRVRPDARRGEDVSPWRPASEPGGFSTYFEKWFCFTHQWNIEVIELRGPRRGSHFNYLFVFYWERKYGCQVYGGKKADPVLSVLAYASA